VNDSHSKSAVISGEEFYVVWLLLTHLLTVWMQILYMWWTAPLLRKRVHFSLLVVKDWHVFW